MAFPQVFSRLLLEEVASDYEASIRLGTITLVIGKDMERATRQDNQPQAWAVVEGTQNVKHDSELSVG